MLVLIGLNPFDQPGIDFIRKFSNLNDLYVFVKDWLDYELNKQTNFVSGLKGDKNKHIDKYMDDFINKKELKFYGEYNTNEPYLYKWLVYDL